MLNDIQIQLLTHLLTPVHIFPPYFVVIHSNIMFKYILMLSFRLRLGLPSVSLLWTFLPKFCMLFLSLPCVLHALNTHVCVFTHIHTTGCWLDGRGSNPCRSMKFSFRLHRIWCPQSVLCI